MAKTPSTKTCKTVGKKTTKTCKTVGKTTSNVKTDNIVVKRNLFSWVWDWLTNVKADNKSDSEAEEADSETETEADYETEAEAKAKADEAKRLAYLELHERSIKWQREQQEREEKRKEAERVKAIDDEAKRKESNPFFLVRSTTDGKYDDWVNCFFMRIENQKGLYFVFSGNKIKELDLSRDWDSNLNFSTVGVAGFIKTTGQKLEITDKKEHFYFLARNKSPYKKNNQLIVAIYEDKMEFEIDDTFYFGQSTWVPPPDPEVNYFWEGPHHD